jgi:hypothetical protein
VVAATQAILALDDIFPWAVSRWCANQRAGEPKYSQAALARDCQGVVSRLRSLIGRNRLHQAPVIVLDVVHSCPAWRNPENIPKREIILMPPKR